jgi:hypothetical protein
MEKNFWFTDELLSLTEDGSLHLFSIGWFSRETQYRKGLQKLLHDFKRTIMINVLCY